MQIFRRWPRFQKNFTTNRRRNSIDSLSVELRLRSFVKKIETGYSKMLIQTFVVIFAIERDKSPSYLTSYFPSLMYENIRRTLILRCIRF